MVVQRVDIFERSVSTAILVVESGRVDAQRGGLGDALMLKAGLWHIFPELTSLVAEHELAKSHEKDISIALSL